jgi:hypothetical protein
MGRHHDRQRRVVPIIGHYGDPGGSMYVRWKRRPLGRTQWPDNVEALPDEQRLYAVLVRSERVNGKPRQRVIKHLGGIRERFATDLQEQQENLRVHAWQARHRFWEQVDETLAELVPEPAERERLAGQIVVTVPRLTALEHAAWDMTGRSGFWGRSRR